MKWDITHRTHYTYAAAVRTSVNEVRLQPVTNAEQTLESFDLKVTPSATLRRYNDFYSNCVYHFDIPEPHTTLLIESHSVVTTKPPSPLPEEATPAPLSELNQAVRIERCYDYLQSSRFVSVTPEVWKLAMDATAHLTDAWRSALAIMRFVHGQMSYAPKSTHVHTHMLEALTQKRGVCQDFAHVTLGLCRAMKIPALYVSGYLATENASATHAWVEVFIPGHGWRGLDPTHNRQTDETYIKLAVGRDYGDVPPVTGHYKGTSERKLEVEVKIIQSPESPLGGQQKSGQ